ncbi:FAD-binding oxidoreductase [Ramlibacter sp. H39-3-26]|nr:FAD-binding oxidoreductase [Ramlibacter sp. H39-3-26]MDF1486501.1 FAD-binding oxidoreductase [Ramlibacter sp. H39-3-26]
MGPDAVALGEAVPAAFCTDWSGAPPVRPRALLRPRSTREVAAALRICHAHRVPVVPQGGRTGLAGGAVPRADALAFSLDRMDAIEAVDAAAATLTAQAGATLQAVQQAAEGAGLRFGVDLGARGTCQIGGNIATNAGGNGVVQFGMMREQVLGLEVVLADGTVLPMLRPMLKNNTGYDLKQFFIGAEGTLGVVTRAVLRLRPAPQELRTALVALPDYPAAVALLQRLQAAFPGALAAFELMWADFFTTSLAWLNQPSPLALEHPLAVLVDVAGGDAAALDAGLQAVLEQAMEQGVAADAVIAQSQAQARSLWRIREAPTQFPARMEPVNFDVSLPLADIGGFAERCVQALAQRWPGHRTLRFGHLGDGNLHLTTDARSLPGLACVEAAHAVEGIVYALVEEMGGSVSAEHGIGTHKKPWLDASRTPQEVQAMRAIKRALDPLGLMNPGKIFD